MDVPVALFEMSYYHSTLTISAVSSTYTVYKISIYMCPVQTVLHTHFLSRMHALSSGQDRNGYLDRARESPDDLLYLRESAKYNSSTLKSQKLCLEWHTIQLLLYCSMECVYCV